MFRTGLAGCGRISKNHFEVISGSPDFELAGVCDINADRARNAGEAHGVPWFTDLKDLLDGAPMDILSICTPSGLHPAHGIMAANRGIHVLTEKPIAVRLADADALVEACDAAGVKLFVVKQNRLNPPIAALKRAFEKGRFGRVYMANVTVRWTRSQDYYDSAPWRGTREFDGGAFMNQASHYVDLLQWLMGPPKSVMAKTATMKHKIECEDSGAAVVTFESGAIGVIEVTMCTWPKNLEGSVTIIGEKGTVRIGGTAVNKVEVWNFADYDDDDKIAGIPLPVPASVYGFGHPGYYDNVARTLKNEKPADTDGRDGRKSLELILGIYRSAEEGREVIFPLE